MPSTTRPAAGEELPGAVREDVVGDPRRRAVLRCLAEADGPVCLTDLAAHVGAAETDAAPADVSPARQRRIREDIYQDHLPKLTATGVVEFDSMRGTLTLRDGAIAERVT